MTNETDSNMTTRKCRLARRSFKRRLACHIATVTAFFTTMFSVSCLMNGTCAKQALASIKGSAQDLSEILRHPAMLRMNPLVHGPGYVSPLEAAMFDAGKELKQMRQNARQKKRGPSFGLASRADDFSRGTDARNINRVQELGINYAMVLPANLSPVSDAGGISAQIFDHSITNFLNQGAIKNSFVGNVANTVEKRMKTEMTIGGTQPESIKHNIKFQVKASETKASMEYRGITNADLSYSIGGRRTNLELHEKISGGSNIVFTHTDEPNDRRDVLSLRVHW